ncbi:MAG: SRPBCC family protein [Adhaeribacter sp.]
MKAKKNFRPSMPPSPPVAGSATRYRRPNAGTAERLLAALTGSVLAYYGFKKPAPAGLLLGLAGGALVVSGVTGQWPVNPAKSRRLGATAAEKGFEITQSLTINKPRQELYQFWRQLENLPRFMQYLEEVKQTGARRSHWVARIPKDLIYKKKVGSLAWDADIVKEEENERIAWRSLPGSEVENAGEVHFTDAPANRGTVVRATISYRPPAGGAGKMAARILNPAFSGLVRQDMRRFKRLMEAGEIPTIIGQPSGRKDEAY